MPPKKVNQPGKVVPPPKTSNPKQQGISVGHMIKGPYTPPKLTPSPYMQRMQERNKPKPPKPKGKGPWVWSNLNNHWTRPWNK